MPNHQVYRWEQDGSDNYRLLIRMDGPFHLLETGTRTNAVEKAKLLRKAGGTHPFKSVTQLIAKSFLWVANS